MCRSACLTICPSVCRYHGDRQGSVFEEDCSGEVGLPGDSGFWDSLLDVLHSADCHREVMHLHVHVLVDIIMLGHQMAVLAPSAASCLKTLTQKLYEVRFLCG